MRRNLRISLSLLVFIFAVTCVFWFKKGPDSELSPQTVPLVDEGHEQAALFVHSEEFDPEVLHDFQSWMADYRTGSRDEVFLKQGLLLAEQRRATMLQLIQQDAAMALGAAIGYADYASLPREMQALVEEPYTATGDVEVIAICDHDYHTPEYHVNVYLEDNTRLRTAPNSPLRTGLSKLDVPLQGIQLDGWTAVQPSVFDQVSEEDVDWAWENLPSGNPDPEVDFLTGEPLAPNPVTAVAGGFAFLFANESNLESLENELQVYDNMPGKYTGSSVIFSDEVQEVQAKGFPIERIRDSQQQLLIGNTTGDKTSLFIRIVFPDKTDAPISKADLEAQINNAVSGHLADFSYNKTSMNATVTEAIYNASMNSSEYAFTGGGDTIDEKDLWDEAVAAYQADGNPGDPFNNFDIVGIIFPKIEEVGWAGLGTVGGANSKHWLNGTASTETIVHEFGHNYGLSHSNYWVFNSTNAASTDPVDTTGSSEEYGDFWDVMGDGDANRGHFHMGAKRFLSWLDANQIQTIDEAGESDTYRVFRFDHKDATGLQGLEIKKDGDENYWIGFRRGFESNANYYRGAYIMWERAEGASSNQGWIIDTTPGSKGERQDAGISLGRTYSDPAAQVHITPIGVGGSSPNEYLDVVVNYGTFAGNNAPTVSLNAPATGDARMPISFSATGNDTDGDPLVYSWDLGNGEVYSSGSSISAIYTVGGAYELSVTVSDMKGGTMKQSAQITIADPLNNWTSRTSGVTQHLNGLADNGTTVVAVGDFSVVTSSDGATWQSQNIGILNYIMNAVTWTGSEFIAGGLLLDGGFVNGILTSPDGVTWTAAYTGSGSQSHYLAVASNEDGSLVIAAGWNGILTLRNSEGVWSELDFSYPANTVLGVAYGNGVFVIGGHDQVNNQLILMRTSDGVNFEDLVDNSDLPAFAWLDNMDYLNGLFLGSGFFSKVLFSENGGISWQTLVQDSYEITPFAFGNGIFYGIGEDRDNGNALINLVSSDGKLWKPVDTPEPGNAVHFFNNTFIIVGDGGSIRQSGLVESADEILAAPDISPSAQEFSDSINVTIATDAENAQIRYTLDDSEPTAGSTLYAGAINITATTTVKAKVFKDSLDPSPTASATYTKGALTGFAGWIDQFFQGGDAEASANPDGDWANNLFEWAVGSVPNDTDSAPDAPELSFDGGGKAVFRISRLSKSEDVTLSIQKSTNMKTWTALPTTTTSDTDTMLVLTSIEAIDTYPCFLRIIAVE